MPLHQRIKVKQKESFDLVDSLRENRLFPHELSERASELVTTFRSSMRREFDRMACLTGAHAIWSMWPGYLEQESGSRSKEWLRACGIPLSLVHSSGHASLVDLQRLATAISAREVVPVHTRHADSYKELFVNVRKRLDGEWWSV